MKYARAMIAAAVSAIASIAGADVVLFDNGTPNNASAYKSDASQTTAVASQFTISSSGTANAVEFYGMYQSVLQASQAPASDQFTFDFYTDNGGKPGTGLYSRSPIASVARTATGGVLNVGGNAEFKYDATITGVPLSSGTYWMVIKNNVGGTTPWFWLSSSGSAPSVYWGNYDSVTQTNWHPNTRGVAFALSSVPEPALLGAAGTICLTGLAVRRRQKVA